MFTQKTRVIIASILLIAALALALRGRIIWEEITQWITVQSLPLISSPSEPLEKDIIPEQPTSSAHDTHEVDEIQVIPTPEIVEAVLQQIKQDEKELSSYKKKRVARRRRKKETETVFVAPSVSTPMETPQTLQLLPFSPLATSGCHQATPQQTPISPIIAELVPIKAQEITQLQKKTIHICNKIDVNKLGVKHWTGTYLPTKLEITLNNVPFTIVGDNPRALDALQEIPCADNRITVCYLYEFLSGMRKGSDTIIYTVIDQAAQLEMQFSWDTPWHVELNGAQRVESKN